MHSLDNPLRKRHRDTVLLAITTLVFLLQLLAVHLCAVYGATHSFAGTFVGPLLEGLARVALLGSPSASHADSITRSTAVLSAAACLLLVVRKHLFLPFPHSTVCLPVSYHCRQNYAAASWSSPS